eukprot:3512456-Rhodomonas_salina.1
MDAIALPFMPALRWTCDSCRLWLRCRLQRLHCSSGCMHFCGDLHAMRATAVLCCRLRTHSWHVHRCKYVFFCFNFFFPWSSSFCTGGPQEALEAAFDIVSISRGVKDPEEQRRVEDAEVSGEGKGRRRKGGEGVCGGGGGEGERERGREGERERGRERTEERVCVREG